MPHARQLRRDAEVDLLRPQHVAELARLLDPGLGEPDRDGGVAVQQVADAVLALAVPGEEGALHGKRRLRYESTCRMPIESYSRIAGWLSVRTKSVTTGVESSSSRIRSRRPRFA